MASKPRKLRVQLSAEAEADLAGIWSWNFEKYGVDHANRYEDFLLSETQKLSTFYSLGRPVVERPGLLYRLILKHPGSQGHIVVFEVSNEFISVVHYFHTAQNWQAHL